MECCGRKKHGPAGGLRMGRSERMLPYSLSIADLALLNVPGKEDDNTATLQSYGGGLGLCRMLGVDPHNGIDGSASELETRSDAFGENKTPESPFESWISLFLGCFQDFILIVLIGASVVSLIVGSLDDPSKGWVDGVAIMMAVVIVAAVTATNDYNKQLQFRALTNESESRVEVQVIRKGVRRIIGVGEVVVGDVVHLEMGGKVPADGIVLRCNDLKCNESALTGESDDIAKDKEKAPVLIAGAQVAAGTCEYVVTAVGVNSLQGSIMKDVVAEDEDTPLQVKLDSLAGRIGYVGAACAFGTFIALMIIKAAGGQQDVSWATWTISSFIYGVTIVVVAIPEGLPLAVTISLAYSTRKMLADQNLIRHLAACETMGCATDICSDKTGTLTENRMTVITAWLGGRTVEFEHSADGCVALTIEHGHHYHGGKGLGMLAAVRSIASTSNRSINLVPAPRANSSSSHRNVLLGTTGGSTGGSAGASAAGTGTTPRHRTPLTDGAVGELLSAREETGVARLPGMPAPHPSPDSINSTTVVTPSSLIINTTSSVAMAAYVPPNTTTTSGAGVPLIASSQRGGVMGSVRALVERITPRGSPPQSRVTPQTEEGPAPSSGEAGGVKPLPPLTHNLEQVPAPFRDLLREQLSLNSTAQIVATGPFNKREVKGSKTEGAGIMLVESFGLDPLRYRSEAFLSGRVLKQYSFSSDRKMMSTLVALPGGGVRMYTTGGSDYILARSSTVLQLAPDGVTAVEVPITPALAGSLVSDVIVAMAGQCLRTLGIAYRDFPTAESLPAGWPACDTQPSEEGLTLYAILGIKDPLRPDVTAAVAACQQAGVVVRMVTGDNKITATAIAKECGILKEGGLVMEGPDFRALSPSALDALLPKLSVLARSSPKDKNILVRRLNGNLPKTKEEWEEEHPDRDFDTEKQALLPGFYEEWANARRHANGVVYRAVVGVTGDGTNDAPALKAADVGLSMGLSGTQVAMDASDIIILDDRFSSIVRAVLWGRSVYDNVQKFLQFQVTVNVVALAITFIAAVMQQEPPLNPVMMLWVNLIMDTMGALALGTEPPSPALLDRRPYSSTASLLMPRMWRHIAVQASFQLAMLLTLLAVADEQFGINIDFLNQTGLTVARGSVPATADDVGLYRSTFVFNAFVFAQIFNEFNARSLGDDPRDAFRGVFKNRIFLAIILISAVVQAIVVQLGGVFTKCTGLTPAHWCITVMLGAISLPLGVVMRAIPVHERQTDFAHYYRDAFSAAMTRRRAEMGITSAEEQRLDLTNAAAIAAALPLLLPAAAMVPKLYPGGESVPLVANDGSQGGHARDIAPIASTTTTTAGAKGAALPTHALKRVDSLESTGTEDPGTVINVSHRGGTGLVGQTGTPSPASPAVGAPADLFDRLHQQQQQHAYPPPSHPVAPAALHAAHTAPGNQHSRANVPSLQTDGGAALSPLYENRDRDGHFANPSSSGAVHASRGIPSVASDDSLSSNGGASDDAGGGAPGQGGSAQQALAVMMSPGAVPHPVGVLPALMGSLRRLGSRHNKSSMSGGGSFSSYGSRRGQPLPAGSPTATSSQTARVSRQEGQTTHLLSPIATSTAEGARGAAKGQLLLIPGSVEEGSDGSATVAAPSRASRERHAAEQGTGGAAFYTAAVAGQDRRSGSSRDAWATPAAQGEVTPRPCVPTPQEPRPSALGGSGELVEEDLDADDDQPRGAGEGPEARQPGAGRGGYGAGAADTRVPRGVYVPSLSRGNEPGTGTWQAQLSRDNAAVIPGLFPQPQTARRPLSDGATTAASAQPSTAATSGPGGAPFLTPTLIPLCSPGGLNPSTAVRAAFASPNPRPGSPTDSLSLLAGVHSGHTPVNTGAYAGLAGAAALGSVFGFSIPAQGVPLSARGSGAGGGSAEGSNSRAANGSASLS